MTDAPHSPTDQTGPWALALGALAIAAGVVGAELLRQRRDDGTADDTGD